MKPCEMKPSKVRVKILSIEGGECGAGHKVGDEWILDSSLPQGLCAMAYYSIFPHYRVMRFGGVHPWQEDPDAVTIACVDPEVKVVFELRRVED